MSITANQRREIKKDRDTIYQYTIWCMKFIEFLVENQSKTVNDKPLIDATFHKTNEMAFSALKQQFSDSELDKSIKKTPDLKLWHHGLYGDQLTAKLFVVHAFITYFNHEVAIRKNRIRIEPIPALPKNIIDQLPEINSTSSPFQRFFAAKFLKKIIESVDIPLDCIISAIGANGAISEVKKLLGVTID